MKVVFHASAGDYEAELEAMKVLSVTPLKGATEKAVPYLKELIQQLLDAETDDEYDNINSAIVLLGGPHAPWLADIELPEGAIA